MAVSDLPGSRVRGVEFEWADPRSQEKKTEKHVCFTSSRNNDDMTQYVKTIALCIELLQKLLSLLH